MGKKGFDVAETKATEAAKSGARYAYFKPEVDKTKTIRFVTADGGADSILTYAEHFTKFKNGWSRSTSCPDYGNEPGDRKSCMLCLTTNKGPGEDITKDDYGVKMIMQVIERGCGEQGEDILKVFKFSPFLFTTIVAFHKEYGDLGDRDYSLEMFKDAGERGREKTRYEMIPLSKKPTPTSDADDVLIAARASLEDIEPKYDEQEIRRIMDMDASDRPASGGTKAKAADAVNDFMSKIAPTKKTPAPVVEEDDETPAPKATKSAPVATDDDGDDDDTTDFFAALKARNGK